MNRRGKRLEPRALGRLGQLDVFLRRHHPMIATAATATGEDEDWHHQKGIKMATARRQANMGSVTTPGTGDDEGRHTTTPTPAAATTAASGSTLESQGQGRRAIKRFKVRDRCVLSEFGENGLDGVRPLPHRQTTELCGNHL